MKNIVAAKVSKPYTAMTTAELREATRPYDLPTAGNKLPGKPLTALQRRKFERARRPGRPRIGKGVQVISMSVEKDLLKRADAQAKSEGISRAELFARGLRAILPRPTSRKSA
ncbi:MAG TPA: hypothetical protein VM008_09000 [Phycisphaerae bacterium]|nr:hypothetical protein [Phycisphaerae bacterium]